MARGQGSNVLGIILAGILTVGAGVAFGYYVVGGSHGRTAPTVRGVQETAPTVATPSAAAPKSRHINIVRANSDYTAPGAPRIHIVQSSASNPSSPSQNSAPTPDTHSNATPNIPTPDVEASQEAASNSNAPAQTPSPITGNSIVTDQKSSSASGGSPSAPTAPPTPPPPPPAASSASAPPTVPNSTTAKSGNANAPSKDSESRQAGTVSSHTPSSSHIQYRVQAGSFSTSQGAQAYAATLQAKGVEAAVNSQHSRTGTVYRVQVGAFTNRTDADQAATTLRHQGVAVTVDSVSP